MRAAELGSGPALDGSERGPCSRRSSRTSGDAAFESIERGEPAIEVGARTLDRELGIAKRMFGHDDHRERVLTGGESGEGRVDALAGRGQELVLVQVERPGRFLDLLARARTILV